MKQEKSLRRTEVLVTLLLLVVLSVTASCTSIRSTPLESVSELPASQGTTEVRTTKPYLLDVGDEVNIKVWGFDEFQKTATIDPSGEISYPLLGRMQLAGKTVPQAQGMIRAGLKKYLVDPQVDITSSTGRQQVYVLGEVITAGAMSYTRPLKVMEALAKAGWFNNSANKSNVLLVRRSGDRYNVYRINAQKMLQDGSTTNQAYLEPGDMIYVPPKTITNVVRFMYDVQSILQPFMTAEQMIVLWPAFRNALQGGQGGLSISTPSPSSGTSQ